MENQKPSEINPDLLKLAKRIKDLRIKAGYSSFEVFAFTKGIHRAQYGRYENGQNLNYLSLLKVLRALDITAEEFFSEGFE